MASVLAVVLLFGLSVAEAKSDKEKPLPPGLQKKVARGGELPAGWQKKLAVGESLDQEIYDSAEVLLPVDDYGIMTIAVEDRVVRLIKASREIVEILK
ncbi:MAG TPA: hypothetical protein VIS54_06080 [Psychromonas sp.]